MNITLQKSTNKEVELKLSSQPTVQNKFDAEFSRGNYEVLMSKLEGLADWKIESLGVRVINDEYWDTTDWSVQRIGGAFRVRLFGDTISVDVKRPTGKNKSSEGLFVRDEQSIPLSVEGLTDAQRTDFLNIRKETIPEIAAFAFQPVFQLFNTRRVFLLSKGEARIELSIDSFHYRTPARDQQTDTFGELEFEALNEEGTAALLEVANTMNIGDIPGIAFSTMSKYERGVRELRVNEPEWLKTSARWCKSNVGTLTLAVIAVLSIGFGLIGIIIGALSLF
ncbi:MAG: CYTH domain-containing protein [Prosthecobacter sp.]|nr:CYTH domain-containing protein [Prosthecobacter sp.]